MLSHLAASLLRAHRRDFAPPKCSPSIGTMSPRESQSSKLDERFLSGPYSRHSWRKLPFFNDLHHEISRSWKQPFSSRLTNVATADFTNPVGSVEQGYTAIPVVENMLASHLSLSLAPMWKSRPLLPTKPCRTTSTLIGNSYMAAGQTSMALHTSLPGLPGRCPERDGWITEIHEKEKVFLLDTPISQTWLFGKAVSSVVEKFWSYLVSVGCPQAVHA